MAHPRRAAGIYLACTAMVLLLAVAQRTATAFQHGVGAGFGLRGRRLAPLGQQRLVGIRARGSLQGADIRMYVYVYVYAFLKIDRAPI